MTALAAQARRAVDALRAPERAAAIVVVLALLAYAVAVLPLVHRRHALEAMRSQRLSAIGRPAARARAPTSDAGADLAAFYAGFPAAATNLRWLVELEGAAVQSGVALKAGDYRMEAIADTPLQRYRIVLPVTGTYAQLRAFIDAVLAAVPAAALEDVQFTRAGGASPALDGRLTFAVYLRGGR